MPVVSAEVVSTTGSKSFASQDARSIADAIIARVNAVIFFILNPDFL